MSGRERNLVLRESTVSAAAERVTAIAAEMDYEAVPTAPRTYRLRRKRRRRLLGSVVETCTVTLVEDRSGVRARLTGDLDELFVRHLGGDDVSDGVAPRPAGTEGPAHAPPPPPPPPPLPPTRTSPTPRSDAGVRPSAAPSGLIAAVPGVAPRSRGESVDAPDPRPTVLRRSVGQPEPPGEPAAPEHTVMRPPRPASAVAVLTNGRRIKLDTVLLIGRDPDAAIIDRTAAGTAVADRSISKTHATIELDGGRLVVTDLHSSNGTRIEMGDLSIECVPGTATAVPLAACTVWCGDAPILIEVAS